MDKNNFLFRGTASKVAVFFLLLSFLISPMSIVFAQEASVQTDTPSVESVDIKDSPIIIDNTSTTDETTPPDTKITPSENLIPPDPTLDDLNPDTTDKGLIDDIKNSDKTNSMMLMGGIGAGVTAPYNTSASQQVLQPKTDANTGALTFEYPVKVPPGRNDQTPNIKLQYNSKNNYNDSPFGYGWTSNIPYIERINKDGVNNLYSENYYYSSVDGELVSEGGGVYTPKIEGGSFSKYTLSSGQWLVTDKKGNTYKFGYNSAARQDDPNNSSHVFKWMIEEARDTNNNYITYTYYKDAGQIYPSTITYSNNGGANGLFEIDFLRSSSRSDAMMSAATGFPSTTNYLINEIDIKVNGTWTSKYVLSYTSGANTNRSLLSNIVQSGQDSNNTVTTLPATTFTYSQVTAGFTHSSMGATYIPVDTTIGVIPADINGDSYPDFVQAWKQVDYPPSSGTGVWLYHPSSDNWQSDSRTVPSDIWINRHNTNGWNDAGTKEFDVNGDGLNDMLRYDPDVNYGADTGYTNDGSAWNLDSAWYAPQDPYAITDLNGDGLLEYIKDDASSTNIFWNNGAGWTSYSASSGQAFRTPETLNDQVFADVNGDGLPDIVKSTWAYQSTSPYYSVEQKIWLNNGAGWTLDNSYNIPNDVFIYNIGNYVSSFKRVIFQDINSDGLADILAVEQVSGACSPNCTNLKVYINQGHTWTRDNGWNTYGDLGASGQTTPMPGILMDANGDGAPDIINQGFSSGTNVSSNDVYFNNTTVPSDLLTSITLPYGGSTTVTYKMSAQYKDGSNNLLNPNLPINFPTVYQIAVNDNNGNTGITTYSYEGGTYFFNGNTDRKFAGFNKVIETDPAGNITTTFYHNAIGTDSSHGEYNDSEWKIGEPYRIETADGSSNKYTVTINKWDEYSLGSGSKFVKLIRVTTLNYDGTGSHKDTTKEYDYDNTYGNVISVTDLGEVSGSDDGSFTDTGSDKSLETISYVANTGNYVVGLPYDDSTVDQSSVKVNQTRTYYDGNSLGTTGNGNPTKVEKWVTGSTYINSQKTYDGTYGTVATSTDPDSNVTTYTLDSNHMYPATVTDALTNATAYTYDYSSGKVIQTTEPNGFIYQNVYDGLDRVLEQKIPGASTPYTPVTKTTYTYTDTSGSVATHQTDSLDGSVTADTYSYYDGLNRLIQKRKEAESNYNVSDYVYNTSGLLYKESLPYNSSGSSKTSPTSTSALYTTYTYDPIQRLSTRVDAVGTTSYSYNLWKTSVTDPRSKVKDLYSDARGNLVQVDEHNSGSTYSTYYTWDLNNKLLNITDALNNSRAFTYDGLGRRLTAEDLHASGDSTFGSWSYTYDDAGNMTQSVSPEAKTINYTYDALNRQLTENYTGVAGTEIAYAYDSCTNGIGKLCSVTMTSGGDTAYAYDSNGNVSSEAKTINSITYTTLYTYDRQGNQLVIVYPDSSEARYTYNTAGLLNQIERKETGGSFTNVISNMDYSPTDKPTTITYANTVITTNTYDASQLYRLSNKTTSTTYTPPVTNNNPVITLTGAALINKNVGDSWTDPGYSATDDEDGTITGSVTTSGSVNTAVAGTYQLVYNVVDSEGAPAEGMIRTIVVHTVNIPTMTVEALVVAGGGGGGTGNVGNGYSGGGGGAGGYQYNGSLSITAQAYSVTVGDGGEATSSGNNSVFGTITANGGGRGGGSPGGSGGSGGGGGGFTSGGTGNQGNNGGSASGFYPGGGGGGAGAVGGTPPSNNTGGNGGSGTSNSITGSSITYAGGGGGGGESTRGSAGSGGGGAGADETHTATTGTTNTGGGGGGGTSIPGKTSGAAGGSGVVIVAYHTDGSDGVDPSSTGGTKTTSGGYTIHKFTSSGTFTAVAYITPDTNNNPVITLSGSNLIDMNVGYTWTDPGYSATDTEDGTITGSVTTSGSVNTAVAGTYQLVYAVVDSSGAPAARKIRTVVVHSLGTLTDLQNTSYTYDANGNITQIVDASNTDASKTVTYSYDDLNRMTSATATNVASGQSTYTQNFTYNAIGNITAGPVGSYTYAGTGYANPHAATSINSVTNTYDHDGNVLTDGTLTNTWNYKDQLVETTNGTFTRDYKYDEGGSRVSSTDGTTTTVYPNKYYNYDGTKKTKSIYTGDQLVATIETVGGTVTPFYNHTDHLNSVTAVSDSSGALSETLDYMPYGAQRISSGSYTGQRQFLSQVFDPDTSMNYLQARFYQNSTGRFISEDPVFWSPEKFLNDPQQLNSYSYARNNPITLSDPTGRWFGEFLTGRQSWNDFSGEVGNATLYMGGGWQTAMDHPYVPAIVGAAPLAVYGAVAAAPYVASAASTLASNPATVPALVRGTLGAASNMSAKAIDNQLTGQKGGYAFAGITGFAGGILGGEGGLVRSMSVGVGVNLTGQLYDKGGKDISYPSLVLSAVSSTLTKGIMSNVPSNATSKIVNAFTESVVNWVTETPLQTIRTGLSK